MQHTYVEVGVWFMHFNGQVVVLCTDVTSK